MRYTVREKFFHIGEDNTINREDGTAAFRVDGRALSLRNHMDIYDMQGTKVGAVQKKLMSWMPRYEIELNGGEGAVLQRRFAFFRQKWLLLAGGDTLNLDGNVLAHNFTITRGGSPVATISKQWVSLTSTYGVDIQDGENDVLILAAVLGLEADQNQEKRNRGIGIGS